MRAEKLELLFVVCHLTTLTTVSFPGAPKSTLLLNAGKADCFTPPYPHSLHPWACLTLPTDLLCLKHIIDHRVVLIYSAAH